MRDEPRHAGEHRLLAERIERGPMPLSEAVRLIGALCDDLEELHRSGRWHGGIEPELIRYRHVGAKADVRLSAPRSLAQVAYRTPEHVAGERLDARSDVYALGALLYHLLAGRPVIVDDDEVTLSASRISGAPASIDSPLQDVPDSVAAAIQRLMATDPRRRPSDASAVRELLADLDLESTVMGSHSEALRAAALELGVAVDAPEESPTRIAAPPAPSVAEPSAAQDGMVDPYADTFIRDRAAIDDALDDDDTRLQLDPPVSHVRAVRSAAESPTAGASAPVRRRSASSWAVVAVLVGALLIAAVALSVLLAR